MAEWSDAAAPAGTAKADCASPTFSGGTMRFSPKVLFGCRSARMELELAPGRRLVASGYASYVLE
jgi:hypothetical protein